MQRIRVRVPATVTNIGPALGGLALAVQLHCSVEFRQRDDNELVVTAGDDFDAIEHPVVLAAIRVFQHIGRAPSGFEVRVSNSIPIGAGLGAKTAFSVAGVIGANNLTNAQLPREKLMSFAAQVAQSGEGVAAAMVGGLATGLLLEDELIHQSVAPTAMRIIIATPQIAKYERKAQRATPKTVNYDEALANISHVPLLVESFRQLDYDRLRLLMSDDILQSKLAHHIDGFEAVVGAAKQAGAYALTISGIGPSVIAFAPNQHHDIADAMRQAFQQAGVTAQTWVLPVDRQGVVLSVTQSA